VARSRRHRRSRIGPAHHAAAESIGAWHRGGKVGLAHWVPIHIQLAPPRHPLARLDIGRARGFKGKTQTMTARRHRLHGAHLQQGGRHHVLRIVQMAVLQIEAVAPLVAPKGETTSTVPPLEPFSGSSPDALLPQPPPPGSAPPAGEGCPAHGRGRWWGRCGAPRRSPDCSGHGPPAAARTPPWG
jgi:hypothetical protein